MTPNDIEVLLHCHCIPRPHPRKDAPAVSESIKMFLDNGLIDISLEGGSDCYKTTEKGRFLVKMLCETPFPDQIFIDPRD